MHRPLSRAGILAAVLGMAFTGGLLYPSPAQASTFEGQLQNHATGRCLDSNDRGDVYTLPCEKGNPHQKWYFDSNSDQHMDTPIGLRNAATGRCLSGDLDDAGNPQLTTGECWSAFRPAGPSWDDITLSGRFLELTGRSCIDGNHGGEAYFLHCNGTDHQRWRVVFG
ncbi:RICIN domain-containing protein [Actinoplanes xinjiangensis]|uniref:Ricin-type beta-trefoil lectin protein n=1 Tax=Actinoplanes xinjiangensis TaxID=512350 RepID=A0A316FW66_9ACTN|nr:ricin-type beta-trefoil lectin domain protein [Actinoplanes xinjiangensis]PWK46287.1 ricin-type beta-trefoil lectin protein [Actinoplanes xinjiangensis]GIF40775.1 hypothetical protein Axi01nite_50860 [Actinoplanes xinjiangensis]